MHTIQMKEEILMNDKVKEGAKPPKKFFYTVRELAGMLRVSASCIYVRLESREWPSKRVGKRLLIPAKFVEEYISEA